MCRQTTRHFGYCGNESPKKWRVGFAILALRSRWMAQTDERRVENPQRLARYQLQRPFHCGIDVTATCECGRSCADAVTAPHLVTSRYRADITKLISSGQHRHAAPIFKLPKCKSRAYCRAKAEDRGASPRGSTISVSVVQASRLPFKQQPRWLLHISTSPWPTQKGTCLVNRPM